MRFSAYRTITVLCTLLTTSSSAQQMSVSRVEPPNWWTGMTMTQVQLMVYGENLAALSARSQSPQVRVLRVYRTPNPSYAFLDLEIAPDAFEGYHRLTLYGGRDSVSFSYPILRRKPFAGRYSGFGSADVIYLITPDRFANGDTSNDSVEGYPDVKAPTMPFGRHGGDIRGIRNHLDYLADLGITALWLNPLVENNMPQSSYHGYAATDLYKIDPRFGTNTQYEEFVHEAHMRGLRVIMDHVSNHIGLSHPWMKNLPSADWLNGSIQNHQRATHSKIELSDIHSDSSFRANVTQGWFADHMPDLNQRNSFVSRYLIQNTIWWIESTGLDGIREDTYPYADPRYLADWSRTLLTEYPNFNIVGEVWIGDPAYLAPYQQRSRLTGAFDTNLPTLTDFALYDAFTEVFGKAKSIRLLFECFTKDHLYTDPYALVTFLDNHDTPRISQVTQGDTKRAMLALKILLTTRGIPAIYYGTEIALMGGRNHGTIRADFPGGFPGDSTNAFTRKGRSHQQNDFFTSVRQLIHLRKERRSLAYGRLLHYAPVNEVYVYLRVLDEEKTLVVVNNSGMNQRAAMGPFRQHLNGATKLRNLLTGTTIDLKNKEEIEVGANDAAILAVE